MGTRAGNDHFFTFGGAQPKHERAIHSITHTDDDLEHDTTRTRIGFDRKMRMQSNGEDSVMIPMRLGLLSLFFPGMRFPRDLFCYYVLLFLSYLLV